MSYIIRTRCPNGCKYKSGYTCVASECPYQTGSVRYDIRLNAEDKPTKINAQIKQAVKDFAERLKGKSKSTYDFFQCPTKENKVISFDDIDETLKEFINKGDDKR